MKSRWRVFNESFDGKYLKAETMKMKKVSAMKQPGPQSIGQTTNELEWSERKRGIKKERSVIERFINHSSTAISEDTLGSCSIGTYHQSSIVRGARDNFSTFHLCVQLKLFFQGRREGEWVAPATGETNSIWQRKVFLFLFFFPRFLSRWKRLRGGRNPFDAS